MLFRFVSLGFFFSLLFLSVWVVILVRVGLDFGGSAILAFKFI